MAGISRIALAALIFLALAAAFPLSAAAQQQQTPAAVSVRASAQTDGRVRVVFDWGGEEPGGYAFAEEKGRGAVLTFNTTARLDPGAFPAPLPASVFDGMELRAPDPPSVLLKAPGLERARHFRAGSRIVVDLYGKSAPLAKTAQRQTPAPSSPPPAAAIASTSGEKPPEKPPEKKEQMIGILPAPSLPAAPAAKVASERLPAPPLSPHVIGFTTTESVGMAAFERAGTLWLVFDRAEIQPAPKVAGPQAELFPPFERVALAGATAFRLKLPADANLYAEGGGLVWRIVATPAERDVKPISPVRGTPGKDKGGGALFWPMNHARQIIDIPDPGVGDTLKVVTVARASDFSGPARGFVELESLRAPLGLALASKTDDLEISLAPNKGVTATRPGGLSLGDGAATAATAPPPAPTPPEEPPPPEKASSSDKRDGPFYGPEKPPAKKLDSRPVFDFREWAMGGQTALRENRRLVMKRAGEKDDTGKVEDLLSLAKMHVANGWGAEAAGYLRLVTQFLPEIEKTPRFVALRGAANALAGKAELAIKDLLSPELADYTDVDFWRTYTLAQLGDWRQAAARLPETEETIKGYPAFLRNDMALALAETALRDGKPDLAQRFLDIAGREAGLLRPQQKAALDYLNGELLRQRGEKDKALAAFEALTQSRDDRIRPRAGLSAVNLGLETGKIDAKAAIDRLEGMRFAWRGDDFEDLVNYRIGALYLQESQYGKGLSILRAAAEEKPAGGLAEQITSDMTRTFRDLFLTEKLDTLSPLDAITLYEEFRELVPPGADGDKAIDRLAERLASAGLYGRAADLFQRQIDNSLKGAEAARTAVRLAAIRLLDGQPAAAIAVIDQATKRLEDLDEESRRTKIREMALLRARALSRMDKSEEALAILNAMPPDAAVNRLRVDIAWGAGDWDEAAQAMQDIILDEDIPPRGPLTPEQSEIVLSRAVALNLADNRVALANMRDRFGAAMGATDRGKLFEVVTRPRQNSVLADRETLAGVVSEVDLFKVFLEEMRASDKR